MENAIIVNAVGKQYIRSHAGNPKTFHEAFIQGFRWMKSIERVWALHDINFQIATGRMVGVIGRNGSGKSTLLRLLGRIGHPDRGTIQIHGRVRALLDLGVGLHPDLTGRENIFINAVIAGLTRREVERQFDSIVDFAELAEYINSPLRTYSTGMRMRLGFAIAAHTLPDILLIDEVLAVGDVSFQRKCLDRIDQFKKEGCTIVFVSHDEDQIKKICDEVIYLRKGELIAWGEPDVVVGRYLADSREEIKNITPTDHAVVDAATEGKLKPHENRFGSFQMKIINVKLLNEEGVSIRELLTGESLILEIDYNAPQPIQSPFFGVTIERDDGLVCVNTTSHNSGHTMPVVQGEGSVALHLKRLDLNSGQYFISVGVYQANGDYAYDYHWQAYPLNINTHQLYDKGLLQVPHTWNFCNIDIKGQ